MSTNPLRQVADYGQSIWIDNLTRGLVRDGGLRNLAEADGIAGVTSNPAIFNKAMTRGSDYDDQMRSLVEAGLSSLEIYERMAIQDVQGACDVLQPVFEKANGTDGFVSLEVSPHLARDTDGTIAEAVRLWAAVNRPNAFIKIPGTPEGIPAVRHCLSEGININITLLFSLEAYRAVMEAHLAALEMRRDRGLPLAEVASVASFFLSRIDTEVDRKLDDIAGDDARELRGKTAIASARIAYQMWKETYAGPRWDSLARAGARFQKPLWASTSTKDPAYSDVLYVESLIGPHTVNTLPDETIEAFRDHGTARLSLEDDIPGQHRVLSGIETLGISLAAATEDLVEEGIRKFVDPFEALIADLDTKRKALTASGT